MIKIISNINGKEEKVEINNQDVSIYLSDGATFKLGFPGKAFMKNCINESEIEDKDLKLK